MRISDWSSDVCSSDLLDIVQLEARLVIAGFETDIVEHEEFGFGADIDGVTDPRRPDISLGAFGGGARVAGIRSEEHTSELQSLMRISYAVFCLKKKNSPLILRHQQHRIQL